MFRRILLFFFLSVFSVFSVVESRAQSFTLVQASSVAGTYVGVVNRKQTSGTIPQPARFYRFTFNQDLSTGTVSIFQNGEFMNEIRIEGQMETPTRFVGKTAMTRAGSYGSYDPDDLILDFSLEAGTVTWHQRDPKNMLEGDGILRRK
jgi:hypothetical protein